MFTFNMPWKKKSKGRSRHLPVYKEDWNVYCKKCKYFFRKMNDLYYLNTSQHPVPNPVPMGCRQSSYKWHVECHHPDNTKLHEEQIVSFDEVRIRRYKNEQSPRSLNYNNDCHWFKKKEEEDEPDWEK